MIPKRLPGKIRGTAILLLAFSLSTLVRTAWSQASSSSSTLIESARTGDLPAARAALANGADVDATNADGFTPLIIAAAGDHIEFAEALVKADADINASTSKGLTALMLAAFEGHAGMTRFLLSSGADATRQNEAGLTAFALARAKNNTEIMELLAQASAGAGAPGLGATASAVLQRARAVSAVALFRSDVSCVLWVDGEEVAKLAEREVFRMTLGAGEHFVEAVSDEFEQRWEGVVQIVGDVQKTVPIALKVKVEAAQKNALEEGKRLFSLGIKYSDGTGVAKDQAKAAEFYRKGCALGNAKSCNNLGVKYLYGTGVTKDQAKAVELYRKGCALGNATSCNNLGGLYAAGRGVAKNEAKAVELYRRACDAGNVTSCGTLGQMYAAGRGVAKDEAKAVELYRKACDDEATWCGNLGRMYYDGRGVAKDEAKAAELYQKDCDDNAEWCGTLGKMYAFGRGVAKNEAKAVELYRRACDAGNVTSCGTLGQMYAAGRGVAKNEAKAVELYQNACDDYYIAVWCRSLGEMYAFGRGVAKNEAKAVELYRRACDAGNVTSCGTLGQMYAAGRGVAKNEAKAVELYQKACDAGNCRDLGVMYANGRGVAQDKVKAIELFRKACDTGDARSCENLGENAKAAELYRKACDADASSCMNLGGMYAAGRGVAKDEAKAVELYRKACDAGEDDGCNKLIEIAKSEEPRQAGESSTTKINGKTMEFVWIPPGSFLMGCAPDDTECDDDEKPRHRVWITKGFEMGKYEVTQAQWKTVTGRKPSIRYDKGAKLPMHHVDWEAAQRYVARLNQQGDGYRYRLPTEAEWEYAARAGTVGTRGALDSIAWYNGNSNGDSHSGGQKKANAWGLHDMLGSVAEWCQDSVGDYTSTARRDPKAEEDSNSKSVRGSSYDHEPKHVRYSNRSWAPSDRESYGVGFRCVREKLP